MKEYQRRVRILGGVTTAAVAAIMVSMLGATYDTIGNGSWRNTLLVWSMLALTISLTWLLVTMARRDTADGAGTHWKRIGLLALYAWAAVVILWVVSVSGAGFFSAAASPVELALVPSLLVLPIWAVVAAIRERGASTPTSSRSSTVEKPWESGVKFTPVPGVESPSSTQSPSAPALAGLRPRNRRIAIGVGATVAALALLWVGDQWVRSNEVHALLDTAESTEAAMIQFSTESQDVSSSTQSLVSQYGADEARRRIVAAFQANGQEMSSKLLVGQSEWEDISVLPWHSDIAKFQSEYGKHLNSWVHTGEYYGGARTIEDISGPNPNHSAIQATFVLAGKAGSSLSVPLFARDATARITAIFRD